MLTILSTPLSIKCNLISMEHNTFSRLSLFKYVPTITSILYSIIIVYYSTATVVFILTWILRSMLILAPTKNLIRTRIIMLACPIPLNNSLILQSNRVFHSFS